jgi:hypothetical protein
LCGGVGQDTRIACQQVTNRRAPTSSIMHLSLAPRMELEKNNRLLFG